jgi:uncharacterized OB-fold protein
MTDHVLPVPDDITTAWWAATLENRLLLQRCQQCDHIQHYPRVVCIDCGGGDLDWIESSGTGVVDSFTTVHRAPSPAFEAPYVIARVRLAEGPTLLTRIVGATDQDLGCDLPVSLEWESLSEDFQLPVFRMTITQ